MPEAYLVDAVRTPVGMGKPQPGALFSAAPLDLAAHVLQALEARTCVDPAHAEHVILGCVTLVGDQGANIARLTLRQAGFLVQVPGVELNRMCGLGQQKRTKRRGIACEPLWPRRPW